MDETKNANNAPAAETQQAVSEPVSPTEPVSRRDFLRRASRDAVETGAQLIPGAAVAKVVLGTTEKDGTRKPSLAERWAQWRDGRLSPHEAVPKTANEADKSEEQKS